MAENEQELAEIMRLKYPKACSNLETGAEFFARMVEDVRKYEAWKVIGFASFEEFCANELGKTLVEVEEIVEGVKLLGGNPTEEEAKKASRSARAAEMVKAGTHTQAEAARELGISEPAVHKELTKEKVTLKKVKTIKPPQPTIKLADPHRTAANIHAKMGADYCKNLITELEKLTN
jgi:predicted transcriptional regulator